MRRLWIILLLTTALLLTACNTGNDDEPPPEPVALLTEAANNIRAANTFRMEVRHSGADYLVSVYLDPDASGLSQSVAQVAFRRALAQYVAPQVLQADVSIILGGITTQLKIFSQGDDQWFKLPVTSWIKGDFAPGFNPETLIAEDTGFQAALAALTDLNYEGTDTLEDGTNVFHLSGTANGPDVTALLVGLIEAEGLVPVDVYISQEDRLPVRLVIVQPETDPEDPTTWTIDVYDLNAEPNLTPPEGA